MFGDDQERIKTLKSGATGALRVYGALRTRPVATINELASRAGVSFPTAAKAVQALTGVGIARELTGARRNCVFAYDRYLASLSEGTEPL